MEWFDQMDTFEKTLWYIAIPFSVFFILQTILTLFGIAGGGADAPDFDGDVDMDIDSDGDFDSDSDHSASFQILSLKNFIIFFTVFGWTGIVCYGEGYSRTTSLIIASIAGVCVMLAFSAIVYFTSRLAESGNFKLSNALNAIGSVYLNVPAKRSGIGKVNININGTMRELEAMTDSEEDLKTGSVIKVKAIINNQILLVEST